MVGWFEIPVTNMDRAVTFYETVFGVQLSRHPMGLLEMAWFPMAPGATGAMGTLVYHPEHYSPSNNGVLVYFSSADLSVELERIPGAGGKILSPKKPVSPEFGFMALFLDSEGNRIALHSAQ